MFLDDEELGEDETCDTHLIEQSDKGYRCAIDVPSVLYKCVINSRPLLWLSLTFHFLNIIQDSVSSITSVCVSLFSLCSVDTSLGKKEKRVNVWSLTQRRLLTSQNKEWKGRLVGTKGKCHLKTEQRAKDISLHSFPSTLSLCNSHYRFHQNCSFICCHSGGGPC